MAHVIVLDSINEDVFVCGFCKTVFNTLQLFMDHKKSEYCKTGGQEQNVPNINVLTSVIPDTLYPNSGMKSNENTSIVINGQVCPHDLTCSLCKKKFKKMKTLLTHLKTHNDKPYQCLICGRCFVQNSHLKRHIVTHKMWPDAFNETTAKDPHVDLLSYTCSYCKLIIPNFNQYRAHLKNHRSLKKYKCIQNECMEFFNTIEYLLDHVSAAHDTPVYSCHLCSSTYRTLEDIASHQHTQNCSKQNQSVKQTKYKCLQCDAMFKKSEKLSLHMLTENHRKVCIHCNKIFTSEKRLRLHLQIHRPLKPFQCNICNSSFHMKKYLSSHMLKHGDKQFKCPVCKHMFKRQDLLQRHMKLHQPRKMFKCPFKETLDCKKEFSRNDKLKIHIKTHMKCVTLKYDKKKSMQDNGAVETENCV